ncbi:MAG: RNase H-like domain-containing protein [Cyanobacteria bacterium J06582_2]
MKVLEHLQQKPDATIDDILLVIQQREQTVQFVNKPTEPNETISFVRNGIQRNKSTGNGKKVPDRQNYARDCSKCGTKHEPRSCPAFGKICNSRKKPNHYAKMCRRKTYPTNFVAGDTKDKRNSESASECSYFIGYSDYIKNGTMENIQLFGREVPMLRDTGASLTLISTKIWDQLGRPELKEMTTGVETYDNHKMKYLGALFANVIYGNKPLKIKIAVVESDRSFGLLGRDILNRCIDKVDRCFNAVNEKTLPTVKGAIASIKLKSNAKPMFCPARKVPLPLEKKVNQTIDELLSLGILEPVEAGGVENCSPVVWVKKGDKLRMCADYKVHVNDKINTEAYPLPCIETIFSKVSGAKYFAKIDLSNAYWQIPLDKKSQEVCTVNTTRGLFRVTRLQQGLKNAAAIFQQSIEKVLKGLPGCVAYQDDILLYGVTEAELKKRYNAVKERLAGKNFTVNEEKCVSFSTTLSFLGYEISSDGVKPDPKHIEKLLQLQPPKDVKEVEAFIGLINYFGRMIPNYAAKTQCINELRQKDKQFNWTDECQKAFQSLVDELTNKPLVQPYSLDNEVTLTTDASEKTIGGVLTQNGHPVIYISRNLSKSEQKYSNIEREGLAVVFAVTRLKQYLLGRKFTLRTDHKPLQYIFNPNSQIPKVVSARLARWAITLMAYDYEVQYTPGQEIGHADAMSRLRFKDDENDLVAVAMATFEKPVIDINVLQKELRSNDFTQRVMGRIRKGNWRNCTKMENSFAKISDALTIQNDLIYNGSRVFIPVAYRKQVIEKLHDVHQGVNALKCIVKNVAWWPLMDNDIEQFVKNCPECNQHRPRLNDSTDKWNECAPWERLHMDWLYDAEYGNILVIADAGSGWLEAFPCTDRSTRNVVRCLRTCFSRFGIPFTVVSDNGKEFISKDLKDWLTAQGCYKTDTPLYSPRSNGLAERAVQTMKRSLKFYNKTLVVHCLHILIKFCSVTEILQMLEEVRLPNCCLDEVCETLFSVFMMLVRKSSTNRPSTMNPGS